MFIIVLIVNVMVSDEKKCLYVGMDVFLIKFINWDYMIKVIL